MNTIKKSQILEADKLATIYAGELRAQGITPSRSACVTLAKVFRVEFQNGVLNQAVLRIGQLAAWARLSPLEEIEIQFSEDCQRGEWFHSGKVTLRAGNSQAVFQSCAGLEDGILDVPPIRFDDANGTRQDFQIITPAETGDISARLKAQKAAHAFGKLREKELKARRDLQAVAAEHCGRLAILAGGIAPAIASARLITKARRLLRSALANPQGVIEWLGESITPAGEYDAGPVVNLTPEHFDLVAGIATAKANLAAYKPMMKTPRWGGEKRPVYGPKHTALCNLVKTAENDLRRWVLNQWEIECEKNSVETGGAYWDTNKGGRLAFFRAPRQFSRARLAVRGWPEKKWQFAQEYVLRLNARRKAERKAQAAIEPAETTIAASVPQVEPVASVETPSQPESAPASQPSAGGTVTPDTRQTGFARFQFGFADVGEVFASESTGQTFRFVGNFKRRKDAVAARDAAAPDGFSRKCNGYLNGKFSRGWVVWESTPPHFPKTPAPQGWAAPLPAGNLRALCRDIARGVKLANVKPVAADLPEPEKPFEVAATQLPPALPDLRVTVAGGIVTRCEVLTTAGGIYTRGIILAGAKLETLQAVLPDLTFETVTEPEPAKIETTFAESPAETVEIKHAFAPIVRTDEAGQVINGNFPLREATGPVKLPPIPPRKGGALASFIEAGEKLAALMAGENSPAPAWSGCAVY